MTEAPYAEGRFVRLRAPTDADLPTLVGWFRDPELVAPLDRYAVDRTDDLAEAIRHAPGEPTSLAPRFVIEPLTGDGIVGCVGHYRAHPVLSILDVWYFVGSPDARGKGYGTEAIGLLVDRLFESTAFERIGATCDVGNVASARLVERLGFRLEGTLRAGLYHHARWHDVAVYGVSRSEWAGRAKAPGRRGPAEGRSPTAA